MLERAGFDQIRIGPPYDTFSGARCEPNARTYAGFGYWFLAWSR
jgi:hypothetical protein